MKHMKTRSNHSRSWMPMIDLVASTRPVLKPAELEETLKKRRHMKRMQTRSNHSRSWMPVIDNQIGSADARVWQRDSEYDFDWQSVDPWSRRIVYYADAN